MKENPEELAGILYQTYCRCVGGVAFNGDPLPGWSEFRQDLKKKKQSDAWIQVAKEALLYAKEKED